MSKVLYIKANPKEDSRSNTFMLANHFLEEYKKKNPKDEIITLDLYKENIRPLDAELLRGLFAGEHNEVYHHAKKFAEADKYIIAAPMWNLSIPAILKAYFDYVVYVGISFKYTAQGPVGLLTEKPRRAMHVVTRGGAYSEGQASQFEMGDRYVRTILGFMGITDFHTLKLELTNVLQGEDLENAKAHAYKQAGEMAGQF